MAESLPERFDRASRAEVTHDTTAATKATFLVLKITKAVAELLVLGVCTIWTRSSAVTKIHALVTITMTCALVVALAL